MPPNRPKLAVVFVPETAQMQHDTTQFLRAIIIDARLKPNHSVHTIQSVLMNVCQSKYPFPLTHLAGPQYILMTPVGIDRHAFLKAHGKALQDLGYVTYPWTPAMGGTTLRPKYKVWVELKRMPPQAWNVHTLMHAVGSFGALIDHTLMTNVRSLERMMAVVGVPDLEWVPQSTMIWVKGVARTIDIEVHGWIEESLPIAPALDCTPSQAVFEKIRQDNQMAISAIGDNMEGKEVILVEFNTIVAVWQNLQEGPRKDDIGKIVKASPHYASWAKANVGPALPVATLPPIQTSANPPTPYTSLSKGETTPLDESSPVITGQGWPRSTSNPVLHCSSSNSAPPLFSADIPTHGAPSEVTPKSTENPLTDKDPLHNSSDIEQDTQVSNSPKSPSEFLDHSDRRMGPFIPVEPDPIHRPWLYGPARPNTVHVDVSAAQNPNWVEQTNPVSSDSDWEPYHEYEKELGLRTLDGKLFTKIRAREAAKMTIQGSENMETQAEPDNHPDNEPAPGEIISNQFSPLQSFPENSDPNPPQVADPTPKPTPAKKGRKPKQREKRTPVDLRRSARISERPEKSYASPKNPKKARGPPPEPLNAERQANLIRALQDETLAAKPLEDRIVAEVSAYCGIAAAPAAANEAGPSNTAPSDKDPLLAYRYAESAMAALESDSADDLSNEMGGMTCEGRFFSLFHCTNTNSASGFLFVSAL